MKNTFRMRSTLFIMVLLMSSVIFANSSRTQHVSFPSSSGRRIPGLPWRWPNDARTIGKLDQSHIFHLLKHKIKIHVIERVPTTTSASLSDCVCVPYYQCNNNNTIITDGIGIIDVRMRRCTGDLEVCCQLPRPTQMPSSMAPIMTPTVPPTAPPTQPPTIPPTQPPTAPPTQPPTAPPTQPPTAPPTQPPTAPPTQPPTAPPTQPPTAPPTQPPTAPPTQPPTAPPTQPPTLPPTLPPPTQPPTLPPTLPPTSLPTFPPFTVPSDCICVPFSQCDAYGFLLVSGEGIINPRQTLYPCGANMICCRLPSTSIIYPTPPKLTSLAPPVDATCSCVKIFQCDANGYIIISGAGSINPRLPGARQGQIVNACGVDEVCCRPSPNGQDSSAGFSPPLTPSPSVQYPVLDSRVNISGIVKNPGTAQECQCIKSWSCDPDFVVTIDGAGIIDPRFGLCMAADEVCCRSTGIISNRGATSDNTGDIATLIVNPPLPNYGNSVVCGIRGPACFSGACKTTYGDTSFGEFPWMVALLIREPGGINIFQCGGSMINSRAVLTAAHCVLNRKPGLLVARFGEWNTANNDEPSPFQEADVQSIVTHPNYYSGGLYHDVAVLILATPVTYAVNVVPICLPQQAVIFMPGTRCLASGWGRSGFEGQYQTILKKVDLPLVARQECQNRLRATKLGQYFQLHGGFICAGGEASRDTCTGDGGGPLVCPTSTGQFIQVGIISWGIGCGQNNIPAVYVDVIQHRQWIEQQLANYGVS